jgi:Uma2 family endonuclease
MMHRFTQDRMVTNQVFVTQTAMTAYTINLKPVLDISDEQFYQLCRTNPELKFERSPTKELIIMPPTGGETGSHNAEISADFVIWNRQTKLGKVFDSSTCFRLPGGGDRSPDVAWVKQTRWDSLTPEQKEKFPPIAPDFVLELTSPTDNLKEAQAKMREYRASGVKLGWLIHRKTRSVEIYRIGQAVEILDSPATLSGEEILPGFMLDLTVVW